MYVGESIRRYRLSKPRFIDRSVAGIDYKPPCVFKGPKIKSVFQKGSELTGKNVLTRFGDWFMKKPVAAFARLMGTGKYTLLKNGNFVGNNFRTLKRVGGGIARMWLIGFVLTEPLRKIAMKFSHKTFGKPKKSQLDE